MKKISEQQTIGEQGVHLLGARLLSVGLSFQPNGPLDAGIDGFLDRPLGFTMSAQIIKLSDQRRRPPKAPSILDMQLSIFAAYVDISLAAYLLVVSAGEEIWKAACPSQ